MEGWALSIEGLMMVAKEEVTMEVLTYLLLGRWQVLSKYSNNTHYF